jgi:DNA-binding transcriptional LysR family regulator
MIATGPAIEFARRTRLAIHELDFAVEEIAALQGNSRSRIALGLLPLAGAFFIARSLKDFSSHFPEACIEIIDGSFDFLIERLRSGRIDFIIGPRRGLNPNLGVVETALFDDSYALVVRCGHPLTRRLRIGCDDLLGFDWIAPPPDTPRRVAYDALLRTLERAPRSTLQTSSLGLTRAVLTETDCIALVSRYESRAEQDMGLLTVLPFEVPHRARQIQVTTRADWLPTAAQERFLLTLRNQSGGAGPARPAARTRISAAGGNRASRR